MENMIVILGILGVVVVAFLSLLLVVAVVLDYRDGYCPKCGFVKDLCMCGEYDDVVH